MWKRRAAEMLYLGRMESFNRFYPDIVAPTLPEHWADSFYNSLPDRNLTEAEKRANGIRYRIKSAGVPFSQARVPSKERVSMSFPELAWALLSPERSVLEAIRLSDSALSTVTSDAGIDRMLEYFEFLAKYGYLEKVN